MNEQLRAELERIYEADQAGRLEMRAVQQRHGKDSPQAQELWNKQQEIDTTNMAMLDSIIHKHGWPGRRVVGDKASVGAFLVLQHADLSLQEKYLPLVKKATAEGELQSHYLPLMEDRILMRQGKEQIYGTQLKRGSEGNLELWPIDDEFEVDRRRAAVGLEPLATYLKRFGLEYMPRI